MPLGPRLVIPGTLLGSLLLALFLYGVSASFNFPLPVKAAGVFTPTPAPAEFTPAALLAIAPAATPPPEPASASGEAAPAVQSGGPCEVSEKFPDSILQWCSLITEYSHQRNLPPDLIAALIWQESGGNAVAYSKSGAVGLMQVMPRDGLAASFMCKNGPCFSNRPSIAELQDPTFNISYGTQFLSGLVSRYGTYRDALKAYGPMNVGYYYADKVLGIYQNYGK